MIGTADLRSEHGGVGRMLNIMDAIATSARAGDAPVADDLAQIIEFLRVFVDRCHHTKEEQLLFPAMRAAGLPSAEDVVGVLLQEHERGREAVSALADASRLIADGDASALVTLDAAIPTYTGLLRAHIVREERDCFDLADRDLPQEVQQQLAEGYDRVEEEVVGGGVHEAFHALLDRLSLVYLA